MGCNCKKTSAARRRTFDTSLPTPPTSVTASASSYRVTFNDGTSKVYGSRLEADAANARSGYTGVVKLV